MRVSARRFVHDRCPQPAEVVVAVADLNACNLGTVKRHEIEDSIEIAADPCRLSSLAIAHRPAALSEQRHGAGNMRDCHISLKKTGPPEGRRTGYGDRGYHPVLR